MSDSALDVDKQIYIELQRIAAEASALKKKIAQQSDLGGLGQLIAIADHSDRQFDETGRPGIVTAVGFLSGSKSISERDYQDFLHFLSHLQDIRNQLIDNSVSTELSRLVVLGALSRFHLSIASNERIKHEIVSDPPLPEKKRLRIELDKIDFDYVAKAIFAISAGVALVLGVLAIYTLRIRGLFP